MKNFIQHTLLKISLVVVLFASLGACGEMFDDPFKDKETGEDVNILIVDFNFFTTRMSFKFMDVTNNQLITQEATITFTGPNAGDIVTFAGEKEAQHLTSQGQLELTVDPNVEFSASSPLDFTVHVQVEGYEDFTQNIQLNSEGKKTFELVLSPVSGGEEDVLDGEEDGGSIIFSVMPTKSAAIASEKPYRVNYSVTKEDMVKFTDASGQKIFNSENELMAAYKQNPSGFFQLTVDIKTGFPTTAEKIWNNETATLALFSKLETGNVVSLAIDGHTVKNLNGGVITQLCSYTGTPEPEIFGFAQFQNNAWNISAEPVNHTSLNISYVLVQASTDALCSSGASIKFASNSKSSFSVDADIYDAEGKLIRTNNFKGNFPETFVLENVPEVAARLVFRNNNPAFKEIAPLEVSSLCSGNYEVDVDAADGYVEYEVVLKAICPDDLSVAVAPTYSGEMRIKNSNDPWQGIDMKGGVANVLAKPDQEYEFRFLWKDAWESSSFITEFDANGNYLNNTDSSISSMLLEDGRVRIKIIHEFEQNICDDLGW
ncbi:hypothetical protein D1614_10860 [Maribellus luteus]|uniref:Uncharacterized protein n=1 Tax=Maribellus luteus TaxID=2305463 RepID=A0A399T0N2_9BACT|nr:hypothetical protein [Maribellus luteus]RIJ48225.1 hypothetical protein D1614_10860 [Maribellus luteus]